MAAFASILIKLSQLIYDTLKTTNVDQNAVQKQNCLHDYYFHKSSIWIDLLQEQKFGYCYQYHWKC